MDRFRRGCVTIPRLIDGHVFESSQGERRNEECEILDVIRHFKHLANEQGGDIILSMGNHDIGQITGDLTSSGYESPFRIEHDRLDGISRRVRCSLYGDIHTKYRDLDPCGAVEITFEQACNNPDHWVMMHAGLIENDNLNGPDSQNNLIQLDRDVTLLLTNKVTGNHIQRSGGE